MRAGRLREALEGLRHSIREVEEVVNEMETEHDPLALYIFVARRNYRSLRDTKSGKRHAVSARISWQRACELGFKGTLTDWERLIAAGG